MDGVMVGSVMGDEGRIGKEDAVGLGVREEGG